MAREYRIVRRAGSLHLCEGGIRGRELGKLHRAPDGSLKTHLPFSGEYVLRDTGALHTAGRRYRITGPNRMSGWLERIGPAGDTYRFVNDWPVPE